MLPATLPLFPLPNVVLFPNVFLPLHIFEPRYRRMVADARAASGIIGMCLLRPGWEPEYEGRPAVFEVGCAGRIEKYDLLPDGRSNIVLRGEMRFRIRTEHPGAPYRLAAVEPLAEVPGETGPLEEARRRLADLGRLGRRPGGRVGPGGGGQRPARLPERLGEIPLDVRLRRDLHVFHPRRGDGDDLGGIAPPGRQGGGG